MRLHTANRRLYTANRRLHGGAMNKGYTKNVVQLTKTFSNLLGNKKKNVKFALKL